MGRRGEARSENPSSGNEQGVVLCQSGRDSSDATSWFLIYEFDPAGYVKDDEKASLDNDKIYASIEEGTKEGNKARRSRGWDELTTIRVALACREIFECDAPTADERFGLHSPYRQAHYILAMLGTSPEPDDAEGAGASDENFARGWQRALKLVAEVFDLYWRMYWPEKAEDWTGRDRETHDRDALAMRALLH